jgi:5-methylcytosine-specific restriction protein A
VLTGLIKKVLTEYQIEKQTVFSKGPFMDYVNHDIPAQIKHELAISDEYRVYGSCGTGAWAETPWVAILNKSITKSTHDGYYIVLLFDTKQQILHLALGVGWTQFQDDSSLADAQTRASNYGIYLSKKLSNMPAGFHTGLIDLSAEGQLTKGYEYAQIISKQYSADQINDSEILQDIRDLLATYEELMKVAGDSILNIDYLKVLSNEKISSTEQQINRVTLIDNPAAALAEIRKIVSNEPPPKREVTLKKAVRNPKIARLVKENAKYVCEICGRQPFIQKNGQPYAEADHIVPLGGDTNGLDSPDNMRCLCSLCHAIITYGSNDEVRKLIK